MTIIYQLKITLERATQKTSENPAKIRNKLQKHSKLICNTMSGINVYFHLFEMLKTIPLKNLFGFFYVEGTTLLLTSKCVNCIDIQLLIGNKILLLNLYA